MKVKNKANGTPFNYIKYLKRASLVSARGLWLAKDDEELHWLKYKIVQEHKVLAIHHTALIFPI